MDVVLFKGAFLFLGSSYRRTSACLSSPTWIYPEEFGDNGYQFFPSPAIGSSKAAEARVINCSTVSTVRS